ncbi:MAG: DNA-directed RNA polymerase subunit B [Sulfolobales archaeon]
MGEITYDDLWTLMEAFINEKGLVRQHLDSFNSFVLKGIKEIVKENNIIPTSDPNVYVVIKDVEVGEPQFREVEGTLVEVSPLLCRIRNLTYSAPIYLTMSLVENGIEVSVQNVFVGELPIMVKSVKDPLSRKSKEELIKLGEDWRDPGGYFIINGSEKVIVTQEDLAPNRVFVDFAKEGTNITHTAKVISAAAGYRVPIILDRLKDSTLVLNFPPIPGKIPFVIMMRALGLESDRDIMFAVSLDPEIQKELIPSIIQASEVTTVEDALDYIGSRVAIGQAREARIERARQIIDTYFLRHLGGSTPEARLRKALYLGYVANKLLELVLGRREPDDKDNYANRRLRLAGDLLAQLFRVAFRQFLKDFKYQLEKARVKGRRINLAALVRPDLITERIRQALATGNWVGGRTGVSQIIDRTNWISLHSHLRRVVAPLSRGQPHFEARDLHPTQWGRMCPFETPEGPNCGLVKNLALASYISVGIDESEVERLLYNLGVIPITKVYEELVSGNQELQREVLNYAKVFLNGTLIGYYPRSDASELVNEIRRKRRAGLIHHEVNVAYKRTQYINEVYVNCDSGRVRRPLLVVEDGKVKLDSEVINKVRKGKYTFSDLVRLGYIEYLDAEEEGNAYIALDINNVTKEHTHLELWTPSILGITAAIIPYPEHNQSPRNSYQSAMAKQAVGIYATNFQLRFDSRGHFLHYPQKPLVQTRFMDVLGYNDRPSGQNFVVAILSYTGYNMEDALIINKSSVERGLARSTFFREYSTEERKYLGGQEDKIEIPDSNVRGYRGRDNYALLDEDGIIAPEVEVLGGHALVGKTSPPRFLEEYKEFGIAGGSRRDTSLTLRYGERGIVDSVVITVSGEGNKLVRVRVRDLRIPEIGDKFASRHGQKGVIGLAVPQYDMPYTYDGVTPDLVINPHALPSRMTIGQLIESIAGKVAALSGRFVDGTPFYGEKVESLSKELVIRGYPADGTEPMYDGRTGELIHTPVFIGIVYYQRLHHMVADKIHARPRGPVQILTRQPTEGRAREGGLRFGEMERDCIIGHGAAALLRERLTESSDKTLIYVCEECGLIGWYDRRKGRYICPIHGEKGKLSPVTISYAFKLLLHELMSMLIYPKIILGSKYEVR